MRQRTSDKIQERYDEKLREYFLRDNDYDNRSELFSITPVRLVDEGRQVFYYSSGELLLANCESGRLQRSWRTEPGGYSLALGAQIGCGRLDEERLGDGVHLWTGDWEGKVCGWNFVNSKEPVVSVQAHDSLVTSIALQGLHSDTFFTGSRSGDVTAWDATSLIPIWSAELEHVDSEQPRPKKCVHAIEMFRSLIVVATDAGLLMFDPRQGTKPTVGSMDLKGPVLHLLSGHRLGMSDFYFFTAGSELIEWDFRAFADIGRAHELICYKGNGCITALRGRGGHVVTSFTNGIVAVTNPKTKATTKVIKPFENHHKIWGMDCTESVLATAEHNESVQIRRVRPLP
eukprot:GHVT01092222.1.p1 GENE.GHVT01092222.1~~GHVT01092222.1.p1  ORF type:complete len:344 (+),score=14.30 GHVT01092222.1:806-1837(+)